MVETVAFLIFVSGIFYVIRWSVINDDLAPKKKTKFGAAPANVGNPAATAPKTPTTHR